jgi:GTP cyclohydrolase I
MTTRGVKKPGVGMITSRMLGAFKEDRSLKADFMALIGSGAAQ